MLSAKALVSLLQSVVMFHKAKQMCGIHAMYVTSERHDSNSN